ncbi:hypothetical protein BACCOPRO_03485 [Phocaeicola coprophilus DSM 18228 = JCM 13818]|uniref:Uncharacterized protein n=1 Tax=Phocaeicola coprophilus DSM 18228 = JCM 13818 TaxID=547042 RepID=S0FDF6_9BACT|nr:hypothetical protein BACCOPRO_03485 [Phocaeicola coprophilus DSM 18228 = JCM 13818]
MCLLFLWFIFLGYKLKHNSFIKKIISRKKTELYPNIFFAFRQPA